MDAQKGAEIVLQKCLENKRETDDSRAPQIEPKSSQGLPKEVLGGAPEAFLKGCRKKSGFQTFLDSENEAAALSESSILTFRRGSQTKAKTEPNLIQSALQIRPNTSQARSKSVPKKESKNNHEI